MNERQQKIVNILVYNVSPVDISELQSQTGVSERTIKYDIATIRKKFKTINSKVLNKKGVGYYISPEDKPTIIKEFSLENTVEEKKNGDFINVLMYLLFVKNSASVSEIAEKLYFSELSIKTFIKEERNRLPNTFSLKNTSNSVISLEGSERDIRDFYSNIFFEKIKNLGKQEVATNFYNAFPLFQEEISIEKTSKIEKKFQNSIKKWDIWISEEAYIRLVLHLLIADLRKELNVRFSEKETILYQKFSNEYHFAEELLAELYWGMTKESEILNVVEVMADNNVFIDYSIEASKEKHLNDVVNKMVEHLLEYYPAYRVNAQEFMQDVIPHLRHTLRRYQLEVEEKSNPLFYQIKQNYQEYFSVAKVLYTFFCDEFQLPYSENEVSYLTIYLYKNISLKNEKSYSIYIVCGTGRGFSKLLETRIKNIFDNIEVIACISSFHLLQKQELSKADFLISTIDLPDMDVPVIKISSFLGKDDIQNIQRLVDYGAQFSVLPLPQKDSLPSKDFSIQGANLIQKNAVIFSDLFLRLFTLMMDLPADYNTNQDKILGITIHLIIALPRYYDSDFVDADQDLVNEVLRIEKKHPVVAKKMKEFLETIENSIGKGIPFEERYALYQYIVNEGEQDERTALQ